YRPRPDSALCSEARVTLLPARRMPSVSTFAAMQDSSAVPDIGSFWPEPVQASLHSRTTATVCERGVGTVIATETPLASGPSALASWLAPANDRLVVMYARPCALSFLSICAAGAYSVVTTSTLGSDATTARTLASVTSALRLI